VTRPRATDALLVGAAKLVASAAVLAGGFRAVSDDDYARLVIAQRFAEAPTLDPSGTSWLPVPFWTYGTVFALFGGGLGAARVTALVLGVFSVLCVWISARWLGATRLGALLAGLVAGAFPWSVWLGAAVLPEAPTAGLIVIGMASLSRSDVLGRSFGAGALWLASFSRYEAWPIAVVFFVFTALDARRKDSWSLAVPAFVAISPIALWVAHGFVRHEDAWFFYKRVAAYKQALGDEAPAFVRMFAPLRDFVVEQAGIVVVALVLIARRKRLGLEPLAPYTRGLCCCSALLAFLMAGGASGGMPTHHAVRALLPAWYFVALLVGHAAETPSPLGRARGRERVVRAALGVAALFVAVSPWRLFHPPSDFARRELELHIGTRARELGAPALVVDTVDFGHLAVTAAFGKPNASVPLDDRDPRNPRAEDAFTSLDTLRRRFERRPGAWLVATQVHAPLAAKLGTVRARNASFTLVSPENAHAGVPSP
jgi:hypothetical protein